MCESEHNWIDWPISYSLLISIILTHPSTVVFFFFVGRPAKWLKLAESIYDECNSNCLSFSVDELCTHLNADHNFYAVCRSLLSSYAYPRAKLHGLLHDIPKDIEAKWKLGHWLQECQKPTIKEGRLKAKNRLIKALEKILNV